MDDRRSGNIVNKKEKNAEASRIQKMKSEE